MKLKSFCALVMLLMAAAWAIAQTGGVRGIVLDQDGDPVVGANVNVTGTKMSVNTDIEGKFVFPEIDSKFKTLTVSYVGMETVEVKISPNMVITMKDHSEMMDEVVVVAFGKQKREAFTGSAAVIKSDDIIKRQTSNPISALEGKVPGLTMLQSNNPTSENTINIRGLGSMNAKTTPLIILDGQPYNGSWNDINPADVDNISVLKDAASNALYGARGANGVIMITTKSAAKGKTKVTLNAKWGVNTDALIDYDVIDNAPEYYEAHYLALRNYYTRSLGYSDSKAHIMANTTMTGSETDAGGLGYILYSVPQGQTLIGSNGKLNPNATLGNRVYNNGQIYTLYPDDWRDAGLRNGFRQEYNLSVSGGSDNYATYFSLGYYDEEGISYGSDLKRYTARMKTDYQAYSWMKVGVNANYSHSESNSMNNSFEAAHDLAPIYPLYLRDQYGNVMQDARGPMYDYGDGTVGFVRTYEKQSNAVQLDRLDKSQKNSNDFAISGYANIDFLNDFRLTLNGGVHITEYKYTYAYNPYYGYFGNQGGSVSVGHYRNTTTNYQQLLNWNHLYGKHNVEVLVGHEYNRYTTSSLDGSRSNIAMFEDNLELNGAIIVGDASSSGTMYNVEGYFGRVQYDYDSRVYLSASYRRDGSSRFHPKHRWGNFWSLGGAWILSKEEWFPKIPAINMLKVKASYGQQGNDGLSSSYYWTDYYTIVNTNDEVGYQFYWKGNPDITWETNGNLNAGIEFDLFNGRLNGSVEYYVRTTTDMLYWKTVPYSLGYSGYYDNIGDMRNKGIEVTLNGTILKTRDFSWSVDVNLAAENNKITYLPETSRQLTIEGHQGFWSSNYFYGEGLAMYTWYLPVYAGPNDSGQPTYYKETTDSEGNVTVTTTTSYDDSTYKLQGSALPDMYGGFGTTVNYAGFDFSANFTFTIGGKKLDNGYMSLMGSPYGSTIGMNIHRDALTGWSEDNTDAWLPRWQYNDTQNAMSSSLYLTDASQLTFKTCQLGYTIPHAITTRLKMSNLRVYVSCDNVYYWTKRKGFDPRGGRTTYNGTGYSPMRTFVGGLNVTF